MATLNKEKDPRVKGTRWLVFWMNPITGKPQKKRFRTKPEAQALYSIWSKTEALYKSGYKEDEINKLMGVNTNVTIKDVFEWHHVNYAKRLNRKTADCYIYVYKAFADAYGADTLVSAIGSMAKNKVTGINILIESEEAKGNSQTTINGRISRARSVLDRAMRKGIISSNPIDKDDKVKVTELVRPMRVWKDEEIRRVLTSNEIPQYHKEVFMLMVLTGMRLSEICGVNNKEINGKVHDCGLTWDNVLWDQKAIVVIEKSGYGIKPTYLPITDIGVAILKRWKDDPNPPRERTRPIPYTKAHVTNIRKSINRITGISFTTHNIRALSGQRIVELTGDLMKAKKLYNHSSIAITEKSYVAYQDKEKIELAEILADDIREMIS